MDRIRVIVTPTTHWDREWVMTFGQYQVRLAQLMDRLLVLLDTIPDYRFMMDGQAVVLEDYLAIRPEKRDAVAAHLRSGRLVAGPWYVLADQAMENGEATIRNLLLGQAVVRSLGGEPMQVGYVPDTFGAIATLPMFLTGFGIRCATVGRGRPAWDASMPHTEMLWQSPDGSEVLAVNHGYGNGIFLSYPSIWTDIFAETSLHPDPQAVLATAMKTLAAQRSRAAAPVLYLSVGIDHMEPRASLSDIMTYLNDNQTMYSFTFGTIEEYVSTLRDEAARLHTYRGEWRGSEALPLELEGTLSSRMPLKQLNDRAQVFLQRQLEPLCALVTRFTRAPGPDAFLRRLWHLLLLNHPHDSVCACHLDAVAREIENRYDDLLDTGAYLLKDAMHALTAQVDTTYADAQAVALVVVNPLGSGAARLDTLVRVPRRFAHAAYALVDSEGGYIPATIRHIVDKNKDLESVYMTNGQLATVLSKTATAERPDEDVFTVLSVDAVLPDVPPFGYTTYWIVPEQGEAPHEPRVKVTGSIVENGLLRVTLRDNGTFDLMDLRSGNVYAGLNLLVDREDTGDTYEHREMTCPMTLDTAAVRTTWRVVRQEAHVAVVEAVYLFSIPKALQGDARSKETCELPVTIALRIDADVPYLSVALDVDNQAKDHCLRVAFDTGIHTDGADACDHYHLIKRPMRTEHAGWTQHPFDEFVDVSDGERGLCLFTQGLPAYEAVPTPGGVRLYLDLLRCVGQIGRAAGANHPTPAAQLIGKHQFTYALLPHEGDWQAGCCLDWATHYRTPLVGEADIQHSGLLPQQLAAFALRAEAKPYATCMKSAENGEGHILRLWNPSGLARQVTIEENEAGEAMFIAVTSLDETADTKLSTTCAQTAVKMRPHALTTLRLT